MTANQRRPGFRLPWSSEMDEQGADGMPGADASADEGVPTDAAAGTEGADPAQDADAGTQQPEPDAAAETESTAQTEGAPETEAKAQEPDAVQSEGQAADGAADQRQQAPAADAASGGAPTAPEAQPDDFLRELVTAMRKVADEARATSISELKAKADEQVRRLEGDAERRREDVRTRAEKDVAEVGEWAKAEAERIRQEAEQRVAARRTRLEQQLAADESRTEAETTAVRERVAEYERELDAYHDQLLQMNDPAAFAAAAKRMPKPPSLTPTAATPTTSASAPTASAPKPASGVTTVGTLPQPAAGNDPASPVEPVQPTPTNGVPDAAADEVHPAEEEVLAARLAQLDATLPPAGAETDASIQPAAAGNVTEPATTEVVVKGLGSFGAITGFRQALSGVAGIDGVALSLGQTGEFVFRATHAAGFDVRGAIAQLEGDGAKIEDRPEGGLRVTLERAR